MTWHYLLRFWLVVTVLYIMAVVVPGFSVSPVTSIFLAVFLTMATSFLEFWLGTRASPRIPGMVAWAMAALLLWIAGRILPGVQVTIWGAILAGGLLWVAGLTFPQIWG